MQSITAGVSSPSFVAGGPLASGGGGFSSGGDSVSSGGDNGGGGGGHGARSNDAMRGGFCFQGPAHGANEKVRKGLEF
jgi:hypothetical protein